jgi:hypothetical protein
MSQSAIRQNAGMKVVLYTGPGNAHQLKIIFLLGCHMIMTHGWSCDDALTAFKPLTDLVHSACPDGSVESSWRALYWAKMRNWINFKETFDLGLDNHDGIQMDEYLHYARYETLKMMRIFTGTDSTSHKTPHKAPFHARTPTANPVSHHQTTTKGGETRDERRDGHGRGDRAP